MCKKCDTHCVYFPNIDASKVEYFLDKNNLKRRIHSKRYNCVFLNKQIKMGKSCFKYTSVEDIKKYRRELIKI